MNKSKAIDILKSLADGMHPLTGEQLEKNHVVNEPDIIRALNTAVGALSSDETKIRPLSALQPVLPFPFRVLLQQLCW